MRRTSKPLHRRLSVDGWVRLPYTSATRFWRKHARFREAAPASPSVRAWGLLPHVTCNTTHAVYPASPSVRAWGLLLPDGKTDGKPLGDGPSPRGEQRIQPAHGLRLAAGRGVRVDVQRHRRLECPRGGHVVD